MSGSETRLEKVLAVADARVGERERAIAAACARVTTARALEAHARAALDEALDTAPAECTAQDLAEDDRHRATLATREAQAKHESAGAEDARRDAEQRLLVARIEREKLTMLLDDRRRRAAARERHATRRAEDAFAARRRTTL